MNEQSKLISEIAKLVIEDEKYASFNWVAISLVASVVDGATSISAYWYDNKGVSSAKTPGNWDICDLFEKLWLLMIEDNNAKWLQCLLQIKRENLSFKTFFEYDDPLRWKVTPKNLDRMPEELRPK
jgi:hypothetical protein